MAFKGLKEGNLGFCSFVLSCTRKVLLLQGTLRTDTRISSDSELPSGTVLDFPVSRTVRIKLLSNTNYPVYGIMLQQQHGLKKTAWLASLYLIS